MVPVQVAACPRSPMEGTSGLANRDPQLARGASPQPRQWCPPPIVVSGAPSFPRQRYPPPKPRQCDPSTISSVALAPQFDRRQTPTPLLPPRRRPRHRPPIIRRQARVVNRPWAPAGGRRRRLPRKRRGGGAPRQPGRAGFPNLPSCRRPLPHHPLGGPRCAIGAMPPAAGRTRGGGAMNSGLGASVAHALVLVLPR